MSGVSDQLLFQRTTLPLLKRSLDASSLRQKTIAHNLANAETDGYKRLEVQFEDALREALSQKDASLKQSHEKHLSAAEYLEGVDPEVHTTSASDYFNGHNNVDVDQEMVDLARSGLAYRFGVRQMRHQFDQMRLAIRGTR